MVSTDALYLHMHNSETHSLLFERDLNELGVFKVTFKSKTKTFQTKHSLDKSYLQNLVYLSAAKSIAVMLANDNLLIARLTINEETEQISLCIRGRMNSHPGFSILELSDSSRFILYQYLKHTDVEKTQELSIFRIGEVDDEGVVFHECLSDRRVSTNCFFKGNVLLKFSHQNSVHVAHVNYKSGNGHYFGFN